MDCVGELSNVEFLRQFHQKAAQQRIPLSGMIDLTHRCNLRCVHCYLGHQADGTRELSTARWMSILDEISDAGCLSLLISGGEPLLRPDFADIYRHAKQRGMLITVFSNGTLISDAILKLFQEWPPRVIDISLYGATRETYEAITGIAGSYARCRQGIQRLIDAQIPVALKTMLLTLNLHEFDAIEEIANMYGVTFRFDAGLIPSMNRDTNPLDFRVAPKEAVEKELSTPIRIQLWQEYAERMHRVVEDRSFYSCRAGQVGFYINPLGYLQACMMVAYPHYDLTAGAFLTGWHTVIPCLRERRPIQEFQCATCDKRIVCCSCPAAFELETGSDEIPSEYLCAIGHHRFNRFNNLLRYNKEENYA